MQYFFGNNFIFSKFKENLFIDKTKFSLYFFKFLMMKQKLVINKKNEIQNLTSKKISDTDGDGRRWDTIRTGILYCIF
jgi:hypothetical protein